MGKFNKALSLLTVHENNCRVLHWNSIGCHFSEAHEKAAGFYEKFGEMLDKVTEMAIVCDEKPVTVFTAVSTLAGDDNEYIIVNPENDYEYKEVVANLEAISKEIYPEVCALQKELPEDLRPELDPFLEWLRIEAFYKLGQFLKGE